MKILFVTYDLPYPLDSGGKTRAYHLIKQLSGKHEVTLFTYYRDNSQFDYLPELRKFCKNIHLFKRMKVFSLNHLLATLLNPAMTAHISHYFNNELKYELDKELKGNQYDFLHLESFYASHLLGKYPVKQVLGTENIEWTIYEKHAQQQALIKRWFLLLEAYRTKKYEEKSWNSADYLIAVSEKDAQKIILKTQKPVEIIENGIDTEFFKFKPKEEISPFPTILFIGNFSYLQNLDAASYIIKDIFPLLKKSLPKLKLLLVGRNIPKTFFLHKSSEIIFRDDIEDIREAYSQADLFLSPLKISSGTQFKILEAMATGLPIVTTKLGSEGLITKDKEHFLIADTPSEITGAIIEIFKKKDLRKRLVKNARMVIEKNYSWNFIGHKLIAFYDNIYKKK